MDVNGNTAEYSAAENSERLKLQFLINVLVFHDDIIDDCLHVLCALLCK